MGDGAFDDGSGTSGSIVNANGLDVLVEDADDPADGIKITVGPGSGKASFTACGIPSIKLSPGEYVITCGSVTVEVVEGSAEIELGGGVVVVSVSGQGGIVKVSDLGGGVFLVENKGETDVAVTQGGVETTLAPDESLQGTASKTLYLHGTGPAANPPLLTLDTSAPSSTSAKYRDSAAIKFAGGNAWKDVGTWSAEAAGADQTLIALGELHTWLGLKNSDDQGTRLDLRAEVYVDGNLVSSGLTRCVTGLVRTPSQANEVSAAFEPTAASPLAPSSVVSIKLSTRIGTNSNGSMCGGHNSATGLRVYFDATTTGPARFGLTFQP